MDDYASSPEFRAFARRVHRELIPKLDASAITLSLLPEGEVDVKFAVELGLSIMMDKPIIAVVRPGVKAPGKLILVADRIIEGDITTPGGSDRLAKTIAATVAEMKAGG